MLSKEVYKTLEVANILGVNKNTVMNQIKKNKLCATKIGSQYRITRQALEEYLEIRANNYKTDREMHLENENNELNKKVNKLQDVITTIKDEILKV